MARPFEVRKHGGRGVHCVASREIMPGELVLLEAPLVSTQTEIADPALPSAEVEWYLTAALLGLGKSGKWAASFCCDARSSPDEETAQWLCSRNRCSLVDVAKLHRVVQSNAFGLESALLGVEYGAAFYEVACRFNHDCNPNCISIRIGGNMAIFTCSRVAAGTELRHSYLPPRLLILPRAFRASHLHFTCDCSRCANERSDDSLAALAAFAFPPGHARTSDGEGVASFKLAVASGDHEAVLQQGSQLFASGACMQTLSEHPLAAIELAAPFLSAYFALQLSASNATTDGGEQIVPPGLRRQLLDAARLQAMAAERIRRLYAAHSTGPVSSALRGGLPAAEQLADLALVGWVLFEQRDPTRGKTEGAPRAAALSAMRRTAARFGGSFEWMRDDLPCFSPPRHQPTPALLTEAIATACPVDARAPAMRAAAAAAGLELVIIDGARKARSPLLSWTFIDERLSLPKDCVA